MPKIVDTKRRARDIAEAVFSIICEEGLPAVSLPGVADRTNLSIGSVRHYFPTHQQLVESALDFLIDTISKRIESHYLSIVKPEQNSHKQKQDQAIRILEELLPLDSHRRQEAILWLRLMNEAIHDSIYQPYATKLSHGMRSLASQIIKNTTGYNPADTLEIERLCSFIDGITVSMLAPKSTVTPKKAHNLLVRQVNALGNFMELTT